MKPLLLALALLCVGCTNEGNMSFGESTKVVEVEGCKYVIYDGYNSGGIVHAANCGNHGSNSK